MDIQDRIPAQDLTFHVVANRPRIDVDMKLLRVLLPLAIVGPLALPPAHADMYTWTDTSGRVNVSNIAPPEGVHVTRVDRDPAPPKPAIDPAMREAAKDAVKDMLRDAQVQALNERVAQLTDEVQRTKNETAAPPPVVVPASAPAPIVQYIVTTLPAPPVQYQPAYPSYAGCDPTVFGCPFAYPGFGYPFNVVVVNLPRFHRFDGKRDMHHSFVGRPFQPTGDFRHR